MAGHFESDITFVERSFPVLFDVEGPLELQVDLVVIIDELGDGSVVATAEHARGSGLRFDCGHGSQHGDLLRLSRTYTSSRRTASLLC